MLLCRAPCLLSVRNKGKVFSVFVSLGVSGPELLLDVLFIYFEMISSFCTFIHFLLAACTRVACLPPSSPGSSSAPE